MKREREGGTKKQRDRRTEKQKIKHISLFFHFKSIQKQNKMFLKYESINRSGGKERAKKGQ